MLVPLVQEPFYLRIWPSEMTRGQLSLDALPIPHTSTSRGAPLSLVPLGLFTTAPPLKTALASRILTDGMLFLLRYHRSVGELARPTARRRERTASTSPLAQINAVASDVLLP